MITLHMDDSHIVSIAQVREFIKFTHKVEFTRTNKKNTYEWIGKTLGRFRYASLKKRKERSIVRQYIRTVTGLSQSQITVLIARKRKTGRVFIMSTRHHSFKRIYTPEDIARLVETDNAHSRLSGPATKEIFRRQLEEFKDKRFERLKNISVSHIYNLRVTRQYQSHSLTYTKTNPVNIPIGERRKPDPQGKPGYLRIDTVHQGDLDKEKGIYHINVIDETTQWEMVGCVEKISESYLAPLLEDLMEQFPFRIIGFHSDCGSEFINYRIAEMLNKMLIEQTKSRSRHCNDNALIEGKNGSIIRKYFGYGYVPKKHAQLINEFYKTHFNVYLNFHRPCGFATTIISEKGKHKKIYNIYRTPYDALKMHLNAKDFLKDSISFENLDTIACEKSDNECAALMQKARVELFTKIKQTS